MVRKKNIKFKVNYPNTPKGITVPDLEVNISNISLEAMEDEGIDREGIRLIFKECFRKLISSKESKVCFTDEKDFY